MGGSHAHRGGPELSVARGPRLALLGSLVLAAVATAIGVVVLWPDGAEVDRVTSEVSFTAPGVSFADADVTDVSPACADLRDQGAGCGTIDVTIAAGAGAGDTATLEVPPEVSDSGLRAGDTVMVLRIPEAESPGEHRYSYFGTVRTTPLLVLGLVFVGLVLLVARWRGFFSLIGLGFSGLVIWVFMLPALLTGAPGLAVGLTGSAAIMFVVLYMTHGLSVRTSTALAGTLLGALVTAGLGVAAASAARVTGIADESGGVLSSVTGGLDFQGVFACALVVAGLGVLNDVTITQSSSVWEIRAASPAMSRAGVFASGMRIGRDHIASTIYTIVFAYAGTALTVLMVLQIYGLPLAQLLATEDITQELVRTFASSIGLVLAVPITTAIAVLVAPRSHPEDALLG